MKKIQIVLLALILIGLGLLATQKFWLESFTNLVLSNDGEAVYIPTNNALNMTIAINGQKYNLTNGKYEKEIAPGSASKELVAIFGQPAYGDLSGDGMPDAAKLVTENSGGSGTFFYIVVAINNNGTFKATNTILLGDRIAPQNLSIKNGQVLVNFAERKAGEPFTTPPSEGKSVWIQYDKNTGEIYEIQN